MKFIKKEKSNVKGNILLFIAISITILFYIGLIAFSKNYQNIYNTPVLNNEVIDLAGYNINNRLVDYNLAGEWEFYYNQWIITDEGEPIKTGTIELPNRWNKSYNVSRKGYASYKITIKNPTIGDRYSIVLNNFRGTYRAFINGELITTCGEVSKVKKENFAKGRTTYRKPYLAETDQDLELVIEIGYNTFGGFYSVPWLTTSSFNTKTSDLSNRITFIILFMIGSMFCFCVMSLILNMGIYKKEALIYYSILVVTLFLNQLTSKDGCLIITQFEKSIDYNSYANINFILNGLVLASYIYFLAKSNVIGKRNYFLVILSVLMSVTLICFFGYAYVFYLSFIFLAICEIYLFIQISMNKKQLFLKRIYYVFLTILLFSIEIVETSDAVGVLVFGTEGITSFMVLTFMLAIAITNYMKIREISKENIRILEVENELRRVKERTLRAQIKPHFIFNTLTCIQYLYHEDLEQGDQALSIFSKHLRLNVDTETKELIKFEEELDNIQNYFQLENIRYNNVINLYYDISAVDFELPILSLQPFVENSIKHGRLMEKEDGWIQISSKEEDGRIYIKIIDNGVGFDTKNIRKNASGILNCKERLKILLNADVKIESVIGTGTIIEISFDKKKEGDEQSESNYRR